ncbi:hypothetical protein M3I54_22575 [Paraburkholderia sp. CNPSo 3274]|uniref:hypothetical protein n=1 Tax=Paraburkholderia sp. CNPSo 3274 TaxID=2940932 RepID=UPI0020B763C7|nr:hypothetical protein [Paraburkholderia sp. CNPSo 3274]MCP3709732.1 hypothetical protein [Paraburkholderia sp. CNPSo 3274]
MATTVCRGNVMLEENLQVTLTPNNGTNIAANSTVETTYTLPGVQMNDFVSINKPSHTSGLVVSNVRVVAANQIAVQFGNVTTGAITPTAEIYLLNVTRCEYSPPPSVMSA